MKKRRKKFRHQAEFFVLRGAILFCWLASPVAVERFAEGLGFFAYKILRIRQKIVLENLKQAFPDKSHEELQAIALRTYQNFAKMTLEYIRFPQIDQEDISNNCTFKGLEHLDWVIQHGKGAVFVAGHFANWELMGAAIAQSGYPISFLVGEQHNKYVDDMMNRHRAMMGIGIIHMGMAVRGVIKTLRNNGWVAMLSDQDARGDGVFVDFMGRPASTPQGPAVFALKTGAPIIFGTPVRLSSGRHLFKFDLLRFDHLKGLSPENIREVTQAYTALLEKHVRQYPDHWFWMHRRWKTKLLQT